jgi:threonine aldolase
VAPVEANELFVVLPPAAITGLRADGYDFYDWPAPRDETGPVVRLVTAWDMVPEDVEAFIAAATRHARA